MTTLRAMGLFRRSEEEKRARAAALHAKLEARRANKDKAAQDRKRRRQLDDIRLADEGFPDDELGEPQFTKDERQAHRDSIAPKKERLVASRKEKGVVMPRRRLAIEGKTKEEKLVGESYFQTEIDLITGRMNMEGFTLHYDGKLSPYSENDQSPEAVGVDVQGLRIGHLPSDVGPDFRPLVEEALGRDRSIVVGVRISAAPPNRAITPYAGAVAIVPTPAAIRKALDQLRAENENKS